MADFSAAKYPISDTVGIIPDKQSAKFWLSYPNLQDLVVPQILKVLPHFPCWKLPDWCRMPVGSAYGLLLFVLFPHLFLYFVLKSSYDKTIESRKEVIRMDMETIKRKVLEDVDPEIKRQKSEKYGYSA